jgi:hypothetical protein
MFFKIDQIETTILARKHRTYSTLVFDDSLPKVRGDTDIERGPFLIAHLIAHNIDIPISMFLQASMSSRNAFVRDLVFRHRPEVPPLRIPLTGGIHKAEHVRVTCVLSTRPLDSTIYILNASLAALTNAMKFSGLVP